MEIKIEIQIFPIKKIHLKMLSVAKKAPILSQPQYINIVYNPWFMHVELAYCCGSNQPILPIPASD